MASASVFCLMKVSSGAASGACAVSDAAAVSGSARPGARGPRAKRDESVHGQRRRAGQRRRDGSNATSGTISLMTAAGMVPTRMIAGGDTVQSTIVEGRL